MSSLTRSISTRLLAAGFAAAISLTTAGLVAAPAQADVRVVVVAPNAQATTAAADVIAAKWKAGDAFLTKGYLADAIIALAASQTHQAETTAMVAKLKTEAAGYATSPATAGKLALVAAVMGDDPRNFGGVDLIKIISDGVAADPTAGGFFGPALSILGLARNDVAVPQAVIDEALKTQGTSGAFGYVETWNNNTFVDDPDSTGMMITALSLVKDAPGVQSALDKAIAWAKSTQSGGKWDSYSAINSTGLLGGALAEAGEDVSASVTWMKGQQVADGGLPATVDGTTSDLYATMQGILLLAETSYATVAFVPAVTPEPTPSTAPSTTTPSAAPSTSTPSASESSTTPSPTSARPALPDTGDSDSLVGITVLVVAAGAGATLTLRRK